MKKMDMGNCGNCTVCCTALNIEALNKPEGVACIYLTPNNGCGNYEHRPQECRDFHCGWLSYLHGVTPKSSRPDRAGFFIYPQETKLGDSWVMFVVGKINKSARKIAIRWAKKANLAVLWRWPYGRVVRVNDELYRSQTGGTK
jgi:hypothetical protein